MTTTKATFEVMIGKPKYIKPQKISEFSGCICRLGRFFKLGILGTQVIFGFRMTYVDVLF